MKNQHVIPYTKKIGKNVWAVKSSDCKKVSCVYDTKLEAIKIAKLRAIKNRSELIIHNKTGSIIKRTLYK